jgi:hypothetical protein
MEADFLSDSELHIGRALAPEWRAARETFRGASELARACSAHAAEVEPQTHALHAQHILLARVAEDLAGLIVLSAVGYEMQAIVLSASAYEVGHLSAFIGDSEARAQRWLDWKEHDRMPWSVSVVTEGALRNAGRFTDTTNRRQYIFYQSGLSREARQPFAAANRSHRRLAVRSYG